MFGQPEHWLARLQGQQRMLEAVDERVRVTSVDGADAIGRHYAEALETLRIALEWMPAEQIHVLADIGSGGGFPGVPIAVLLPGTEVHLVEPLQKRAKLLGEIASKLELTNVHTHADRAEIAGRGPLREHADMVTARAVASLPELLEYVAPYARTGGIIILPKGSRLEQELEDAQAALAALFCEVRAVVPMRPVISEMTRVLVLEKTAATPAAYPRRAGLPGKRPIANR